MTNDAYDRYQPGADTDFPCGGELIATVYEVPRARPDVFARSLPLIKYDEHGATPTGLAATGDAPGLRTRLLRPLRHRKARAFDFTMLGPRVPAVMAGTVDINVHEHAGIPATPRALFRWRRR